MTTWQRRFRLFVCLALLGLPLRAMAVEAIEVAPVTADLLPGQLTTSISIRNRSTTETSVQIRAFAWNQAGGQDQLLETRDLAVGPPFATIQPGQTQIIRVVLRTPAKGREQAYRILIDQLPPPPERGTVQVALRLSVPIFAQPQAAVAPDLSFKVVAAASGTELIGTNNGSRRARVIEPRLRQGGGLTMALQANANPYILPGATRRWRVEGVPGGMRLGSTVELEAKGDNGPIAQAVPVDVAGAP